MARVLAPNKKFTGVVAGVSFVNGVGETDEAFRLSWFENKGYTIEVPKTEPKTDVDAEAKAAAEKAAKEKAEAAAAAKAKK